MNGEDYKLARPRWRLRRHLPMNGEDYKLARPLRRLRRHLPMNGEDYKPIRHHATTAASSCTSS